MPTDQEMQETATRFEAKFYLPRFAFGIDGVVMTFDGAPCEIPAGTVKQDYWNRKCGGPSMCRSLATTAT